MKKDRERGHRSKNQGGEERGFMKRFVGEGKKALARKKPFSISMLD